MHSFPRKSLLCLSWIVAAAAAAADSGVVEVVVAVVVDAAAAPVDVYVDAAAVADPASVVGSKRCVGVVEKVVAAVVAVSLRASFQFLPSAKVVEGVRARRDFSLFVWR